jgi:uncharacterized SAM-binding protein YcdF (DUF218 family)
VALLVAPASSASPSAAPSARADAALVLSGDVDYLRLQRAIQLFKARAVPFLILTGAGVGGDSAAEMEHIAVSQGVPKESILLETRSTTTRENLLFVAPLLRAQELKRVLLVTSESHMRRALLAAQKAVPDVTWIPDPVPDASGAGRIESVRAQEWLKLLYYALKGWI